MNINSKLEQIENQKKLLEQQKRELITKRKEQIGLLAEKTKTLPLKNDLLIGAMIYAKNAEEQNNTEQLTLLRSLAEPFLSKKQADATTST